MGAAAAVLDGNKHACKPSCEPLRSALAKFICRCTDMLLLVLMLLFWQSAGAGAGPCWPRP